MSTFRPEDLGPDPIEILWKLAAAASVLLVTAPGLALFYSGLVRKKNVVGVLMQCLFLVGVMSIVWTLYGYSLCYGDDVAGAGLIGDFRHVGMRGVLATRSSETGETTIPLVEGTRLPRLVHFIYQMMFFVMTPSLICGAYAERMKFSSMVLFSVLWGTFVYCPIAHWIWSSAGWCSMHNPTSLFPALDFAGGVVVHISSGFAALACAVLLGRRLGYRQDAMPPHNLTYACLGAMLMWIGWFLFNAGNADGPGYMAANAFVATHLAATAGMIAWVVVEWRRHGRPGLLGACSGAVSGLVCITPASGFVSPLAALVAGAMAGSACYYACSIGKNRLGYDDALDAFGIHGVAGMIGAILTAFCATRTIAGGSAPLGLIDGHPTQLMYQSVAVFATIFWSVTATTVILKIVDNTIGLRVAQMSELQGLDISEHGEEGYIFL